ncbi:MAG: hypothetical protein K5880_10230 [Hydrogenophaga sp.]|uniref:hypothetical protein n=1 Tax=Hydrogenophaga sp. TaxID=1904254 RepID=UPI002601C252|nr:hypothetical protein [Hydrogenophaga sp.]MCV0439000.1 hypothetical protein [Hydrogenophaga sp.]
MNKTDSVQVGSSQSTPIDQVLQQFIALGEVDRARVMAVLDAMRGKPSTAHSVEAEGDREIHGDEVQESEVEGVMRWYEGLDTGISPYDRVQMIDAALEEVAEQASVAYLQEKRRTIMDDAPAVSVRVAVTRIASEQPWLMVGGVVGVILGGTAMIRWGLGLVF